MDDQQDDGHRPDATLDVTTLTPSWVDSTPWMSTSYRGSPTRPLMTSDRPTARPGNSSSLIPSVKVASFRRGETFGVSDADARVVAAGFVRALSKGTCSAIYGLSYETWMEHVQEDDFSAFRKAAI